MESTLPLDDVQLHPDKILGRRVRVVMGAQEEKIPTIVHLEFETRAQLADFCDQTIARQWASRMNVEAMRRQQMEAFTEYVRQQKQTKLNGGDQITADDLLRRLEADDTAAAPDLETEAQRLYELEQTQVYGGDGVDLNIFPDKSMADQNYATLSIMRDVLHTVACAAVLPFVGGSMANPEGNVMERSNLVQSLMGTQIVGHMLRLASRAITLTGSVSDATRAAISSYFGDGSTLSRVCTTILDNIVSTLSKLTTIGTLLAAGVATLAAIVPESVMNMLQTYVAGPVADLLKRFFRVKDVVQQNLPLQELVGAYRTGSWMGTFIAYLLNPQPSMLVGVTYAVTNLLQQLCGSGQEEKKQDGSIGGLATKLCQKVQPLLSMGGSMLTITSIAISIVHSLELILFGVYRSHMPSFGYSDSVWKQAYNAVVHGPAARMLSMPCLPQLERNVYTLSLNSEADRKLVCEQLGGEFAQEHMANYDVNDDGKLDMHELTQFTTDMTVLKMLPDYLRDVYWGRLRESRSPEERKLVVETIRQVAEQDRVHARNTREIEAFGMTLRVRPLVKNGLGAFVKMAMPWNYDSSTIADLAKQYEPDYVRGQVQRQLEKLGVTMPSDYLKDDPATVRKFDSGHIDGTLTEIIREQTIPQEHRASAAEWLRRNLPRGRNAAQLRTVWGDKIGELAPAAPGSAVIVDQSDFSDKNTSMLERFAKTFGYRRPSEPGLFSRATSFFTGSPSRDDEIYVVLGKDAVVTNVQRDYLRSYVEQLRSHPTADLMVFSDHRTGVSENFYLLRNRPEGVTWDATTPIPEQLKHKPNIDAIMVDDHMDVDLSVINPVRADDYLGRSNVTEQHDPDRVSHAFCVHLNAESQYVREHQQQVVRRAGDDTPPEGWNSFTSTLRRVWGQMTWVATSDETLHQEWSPPWSFYGQHSPTTVEGVIVNELSSESDLQPDALDARVQYYLPIHAKDEPEFKALRQRVLERYVDHRLEHHDGRLPDGLGDRFPIIRAKVENANARIDARDAFHSALQDMKEKKQNFRSVQTAYDKMDGYQKWDMTNWWELRRARHVNSTKDWDAFETSLVRWQVGL